MVIVTFSFSKFTLSVVLQGKGQNCPLLPFSLIFVLEGVGDLCVQLKWNPDVFAYVGESVGWLAD